MNKKIGIQSALIIIILFSILFNQQSEATGISSNHSDVIIQHGEKYFKNIKQLTFSGENAEAYFSCDGKELIFQSHDGDSLCDQIYIMDITSGKSQMVSTGNGVTTCSYFEYPDCKKILYASTHLGAKECPPKPDFSKGYVWKLYSDYDIFRSNRDGSELEQLTNSPNYDAEATVAFDGSKIVYTSLVSGDLEIWTMNTDGTDKQQLTNRLGYDGGPFFSPAGDKIVWRVYHPETPKEIDDYKLLLDNHSIRPMALQLWIMNADGTEKRQVTNNSAANFGPYFFPDGKRIIFSSNLHDPQGRDFDLYAVNIDGTNLERITFYKGFDGFPMFSPDGKYLVFSSNRNQAKQGDTNIFICEWINL